ncbi:hypothetical protein GCM10027080_35470 [Pedococcus soli]
MDDGPWVMSSPAVRAIAGGPEPGPATWAAVVVGALVEDVGLPADAGLAGDVGEACGWPDGVEQLATARADAPVRAAPRTARRVGAGGEVSVTGSGRCSTTAHARWVDLSGS